MRDLAQLSTKKYIPVNYSKHGCKQTNSENIIGIREETNTSYNASTNMIPRIMLARTRLNFLETHHPKGALSISARARRRRSLGSAI